MAEIEDAESLKLKGNKALMANDVDRAIFCFTEALELDDQNHILYSNRAAAYCKKEKWIDAVVDGEKVTQLKPTWAKGWARLGTAHFGGKDYIGARRAYDKALELDPDNEDYKTFVAKSKESAETAVDAQKAAVPELLIKFCEEGAIDKLKAHERTKAYFKDKGFCKKIEEITQEDREQGKLKLKDHMFDSHIMQCIGILTDIMMPNTSAGRAIERETLMISSEEEDGDSSSAEESEEDTLYKSEPLPKPISVVKKQKREQELKEMRSMTKEETRAKVAAAMGVDVDRLDVLLHRLHKTKEPGDEDGADADNEDDLDFNIVPSDNIGIDAAQDKANADKATAGKGGNKDAGAKVTFADPGPSKPSPDEAAGAQAKTKNQKKKERQKASAKAKKEAAAAAAGGDTAAPKFVMKPAKAKASPAKQPPAAEKSAKAAAVAVAATATPTAPTAAVPKAEAAKAKADSDSDSDEFDLPDLAVPESAAEKKALSLEIKAEATAAYKAKKFGVACKLYTRCLDLDPTNMVFLLNQGAVYLEWEKFTDCIRVCDAAVKLGVTHEADTKLIAKACARKGKALAAQEEWGAAHVAMKDALSHHRSKDYLEAKDKYLRVKVENEENNYKDPLKAQGAKARGNELYKKGKYAEAVLEYSDAIKRDPANGMLTSRVYSNRAACYNQMGEVLLAVKDCDHCIAADPKFVKGYMRKGAILNKIEQYQDALPVFEKILELDPHNFDGRKGLEAAKVGFGNKNQTHKQRAEEAMQDPQIQEIWESSRELLKDMAEDPESREVKKQLDDPIIRRNLDVLRKSGLLG